VANRGNGTIVRMNLQGDVLAVRHVEVGDEGVLGPGRINGIGVSPNGQTIWLTVSGPMDGYPEQEGAVIEVPAFGGPKL
jgi:hypothetical protein